MNYASKRWLRVIAICSSLTATAWAQAIVFPDGPDGALEDEGAVVISDDSGSAVLSDDAGSVRLGDDAYGSVTVQAPVPPSPPIASPEIAYPQQVMSAPFSEFQGVPIPDDGGVGFASTAALDRILWRVGGVTMDQYGIQGGYTNINAFIPIFIENSQALWWLNPRANITDHGDGAASVGFGRRVYVPEEDRVYGASFWWDYDPGHSGVFHRLGGSFESIGQYFSLRGNFALPIGPTLHDISVTNLDPIFVGNQIAVPQLFNAERAYSEYDVEVTTPFPGLGRYGVDLGVGAYYLASSDNQDAVGLSLRTQAQVTEDFWINGILTNDDLFNTQFSLNFELTMPDGMPSRWFRRKPVAEHLVSSVQRRYRVPVHRFTRREEVIVTDPNGGDLNIAFIDPNRTIAGDGSRANPFMSVAEYMATPVADRSEFDLVFVNRRNDGTDTNLNTTVTLLDFQALIGNGTLPDGGRPTIQGRVGSDILTIPLPVTDGPLPLLTNSAALGSNVVTLANANTVGGFNIDASGTADGIFGANIDSFNINNNIFQNVVEGINITSNTTPVLGIGNENLGIIESNIFNGAGFNSNRGVAVRHTAGTLKFLLSDNEITGFRGEDANGNGILDLGEDNDGNGGAPDRGIGVQIIADGAGAIINAVDVNGDLSAGIRNNVVYRNGTGIELVATNGARFDADVVSNNESVTVGDDTFLGISGNLDGDFAGFIAKAENNGQLLLSTMAQNSIRRNEGDGVQLIARSGGRVIIPKFEDLDADGVLDPGEDLNGNGELDLGFIANNVSDNNGNGLMILADGAGSLVDASIGFLGGGQNLRNTFNNNGRVETIANEVDFLGSGVLLTTANGGLVNGRIDNNLIDGNVQAGITIAPNAGIVDLESISGNTITNNGLDDGEELPAGAAAGDAIVYAPSNGGEFSVGQFTNNVIEANRGAIIRVGGDGGIIDLGVIENTVFDRTEFGTAGILFDATNATITGVLRNNVFIGSEENEALSFGIGGEVRGGTLDLVIEDNLFNTNSGAGIGLILTESDDRLAPGTGTPLVGQAAEASLIIVGNEFRNTLAGSDDRFLGSAISLQLQGSEQDPLAGQNDINGDGIPDAPLIPSPNGGDSTTTVQPAAILEAVIAENLIGHLTDVARGNAGPGIDIRASGDTTLGDLASVGSTIDRAELNGVTIGAGPGLPYAGNIIANNGDDGIRVRRSGSAIIDNFRIDGNVIQNNLEDGIDIVGENNGTPFGIEEILDFEIVNNQIINNGFLSNGQQGSAGRGIQLRADADAVLEVNIRDNLISGNRLSGIEARTFTDSHLYIPGSFGDGRDSIYPGIGGDDGAIFGVWERNRITANGFFSEDTNGNGIIDTEDANGNGTLDEGEDLNGNGAIDILEGLDGNLVVDMLRDGHGIALGRVELQDPDAPSGIVEGFNNGGLRIPDRNGDGIPDFPTLTIQDNFISGNAEDGVHIFLDKENVFSAAAGEFRTTRIDILRNDIVNNGDDGLDLNNPTFATGIVNFNDNLVSRNGVFSGDVVIPVAGGNNLAIIGDGLQIRTAGTSQTTFNAARNRITANDGRGVNIINVENGYLLANFDRNTINSNAREGFYVVNADFYTVVQATQGLPQGSARTGYTSDTWMADMESNHEMFMNGKVNVVGFNGGNTPDPRIAPFFFPNYAFNVVSLAPVVDLIFTSNIIDNNGGVVPDPDVIDGVQENPYSTLGGFVLRTGSTTQDEIAFLTNSASVPLPFQAGGVRALVTDNRMSGNYGRDVYMDGFLSTVPPNVTVVPDPLIRIDLVFENNRGGSISVENHSAGYTNTAPTLPGGQNNTRPNPPFGAQDGFRDVTFDIGPDGFPGTGLGPRTLRIEAGGAGGPFGIGNNQFNLIYSNFNAWQVVPDSTLLPIPPFPVGY